MHFSKNEVYVEGILQEVDLITGNDKNNKPYIRGHVIINVDQTFGGKDEHEEIKVSFYSGKYTNAGKENPAYKSIEALGNMKRISTDGDQADGIRFNKGTISEYAFKPQGGDNIVSGWQINNSFFTKVSPSQLKQRAVFKNEIFIREISDEVNSNGEETGRLKIVGILANGYGDVFNGHVVTYYAENKQVVDHISKNWNEGDTVDVGGYIRTCVEMVKAAPEMTEGFGEEIDMGGERTRHELIITTGSMSGKDEDVAFQEDEMRQLMSERKNRIDAQIANSAAKKAAAPAAKRSRSW